MTARAMAALALPAPTTIKRPFGAAGKKGGTHNCGWAEATAASKAWRSKSTTASLI
jgi:hypothetical protein